MRKLFRKPMALLIALALIAGSMSVAVFALTEDEHGIFNVYTKFYRVDSNGDPLEDEISGASYTGTDTCDGTLYVKKGDRIKAVMSFESLMADGSDPDSEFNVYQFSMILSFNKNLLELESSCAPVSGGKYFDSGSSIGQICAIPGETKANMLGIYDPDKTFVIAQTEFLTDEEINGGYVLTRDGTGKDLITWYFTVKNDITDLTQESVFGVEGGSVCSKDDHDDPQLYMTWVSSADDISALDSSWYYLDVNSYSETLAVGGTVTYNTNNTAIPVTGTIVASDSITDKGNGVYEESGQHGDDATLPTVTTTDGSEFLGWADTQNARQPNVTAATLKADEPDTLYAVYRKPVTITFNLDNGQPAVVVNGLYAGDTITAANVPTGFTDKEGHSFTDKWTDSENNEYTSAQIAAMAAPSVNTVFTAQWQPNDYPITYVYTYENVKDADKLEAPETVEKTYDTNLPEVAAASKDGYTVTDWVYYDANDNEITTGKMPAGPVTAKATQSGIPYTLTYTISGDIPAGVIAPADSNVYYIGDTAALESVSPVDGFTFSGWKLNGADVTEVTFGADNIEVTGEWTRNDYTITYEYTYENVKDADKLEAPEQVTKAYQADLPEVAAATKDGYTVTDWVYYDADDNEITDGKMPAGNVTAKATQSGIAYSLTYTFTGDVPAGITAPTDDNAYYIGDTAALETVSPVDGFTFNGWKFNNADATEVTFGADNIEVTGEWTRNNYTITYEYTYENVKDADKLVAPEQETKAYQVDLPEVAAATKDGYTVTDWVYYDANDNEITDGKMPAGNVTAKATQSGIAYELTYSISGDIPAGVVAPTDANVYYIGDTATLETITAPEGYTFSGWKLNDSVVTEVTFGADNIEVTGEWTRGEYTITCILDNGEENIVLTYNYGDAVEAPADPEKEGYKFIAWSYLDEDGETTIEGDLPTVMPAYNIVATAQYEEDEFTATYMVDGEELDSYDVIFGEEIDTPADPEKDGYNFTGWLETTDNKAPEDYADGMPAKDLVFDAQWEAIDYTLTYTYTGDVPAGLTAPTDTTAYHIGDSKTLETVDEVDGFTFSGWKLNDAVVTEVTFGADDIEVTGEWTRNNYTITYEYTYENVKDADKLEAPEQVTKAYQADLPEVAAASKDGYTVTDWVYYDADDNEITDGKMPAGNVTAKATQSGIPYTLTYTFTGEAPAGVTAPTDSAEYYIGDSKTLEVITAPAGYTFSGWKLNDSVVTEVTFDAGNIEVIGEWTKNSYTITYEYTYENVKDADKLEAPAQVTKAYGADLPEVAAATKDGYTVTDWVYYDADDNEITDGKMPAGNVTAKATQSGIAYSLTYAFTGEIPDGVTAPTDSNNYYIGDTVSLAAVNEVSGYAFSGWKLNDAVVTEVTFGAGDIAVAGEWVISEYTVTFVVEGAEYGTVTVDAGAALTAADFPEDPTKQYYTFAGWADSNGTPYAVDSVVESDITLYAQWNRIPVKLIPADGNTTTMIERSGKIETYNTESIEGFNSAANARAKAKYAPYGVTSVEQAYTDTYGYTYTPGANDWFIYGLTTRMAEADLADYIKVYGDGRYEVDGLKRGKVVNGTTVSVYDRNGTVDDETDDVLVEMFYIVIFGDVNCDGTVTSSDTTAMNKEIEVPDWSDSSRNYKLYMVRAANLTADASFTGADVTAINKVHEGTYEINQTTGKAVAKS
ncbi:MAG: InlB B-repeat-containing protein [Clostridia bacterium]|nr:InlB B-repeat-containing protein [Clostridia bacterium]